MLTHSIDALRAELSLHIFLEKKKKRSAFEVVELSQTCRSFLCVNMPEGPKNNASHDQTRLFSDVKAT